MLTLENGERLFVEAKRFGKIQELAIGRKTLSGIVTPGQLALPSMATDRTPEEQQAINYAFKNDGKWAILSNFERLRLFNARRDWLVLSFENPQSYLDEFEHLWQLAYENVVQGGLEALSDQRVRSDVDTDYLNFINEWRLKLAQDIVQRPRQNPWLFSPDGTLHLADLRAVVQRILDRLVVVRYAEDHLIAPAGTLYSLYELSRKNPYSFTLDQQLQQLYRRFDERHNSALFTPGLTDQASFSDPVLGQLIEKLYEARYRAMTPDIMGNTYEQYLGKALVLQPVKKGTLGTQRNSEELRQVPTSSPEFPRVRTGSDEFPPVPTSSYEITTRDNLETRKKQGSYYTPQVIVRYLVDSTLGRTLYGTANGQPDGPPLPGESQKTYADIRDLRVIDPACGSGSFLIYAYEVLANFYRREIRRLAAARTARYDELVAQGMTTPFDLRLALTEYTTALVHLEKYPYLILERHLYGVDLDPQAAEIATVNLIMRAMADQQGKDDRLPLILNQNVQVGNALIGTRPQHPHLLPLAPQLAELRQLRQSLTFQAQAGLPTAPALYHDPAHLSRLAQLTQALNETLNVHLAPTFAHLGDDWAEQIRPFHWAVAFPELFVDEAGQPLAEQGGFSVVIGNPPWEILKPDLREYYAQFDPEIESKLTRPQVEARITQLQQEDPARQQVWQAQTARTEASATYFKSDAYTRQGKGDTATHKLFTERGYSLLRDQGRLGFVIPSGIYSDLGTKELREMLLTEGKIEYLYNFSNERYFFPAVDHRVKFTLLGAQKGPQSNGFWATFRFDPRVAIQPSDLPTFLADGRNLIFISLESLHRFSPESMSVMEFKDQEDADITAKMYGERPLLGEEIEEVWNLDFVQDFHITNDRHLFNQNGLGLPLFEGKMIHQFNANYGKPQYWVEESKGIEKLKKAHYRDWYQNYRIAFREIARSTDARTCIAAILPKKSYATITLWTATTQSEQANFYVMSVFNSYCFDYLARFRVGTHMTLFLTKQLPIPRLVPGDRFFDAIVPRAARLTCTTPAFADLWQTVMGTPWQPELAAHDPTTRQHLRDELDALVAHLYGCGRDDYRHILNTFPLVFPPSPEGRARLAAVLAAYDRMRDMS